ncbi:MAG: hypothetical protein AAGF71_04165 [Pseudomonadota bacterium]
MTTDKPDAHTTPSELWGQFSEHMRTAMQADADLAQEDDEAAVNDRLEAVDAATSEVMLTFSEMTVRGICDDIAAFLARGDLPVTDATT